MSNKDIAWAAGFFEGEGYVQCVKRKNKKRTDRYFSISIAQVDRRPLDKFVEIFGGKVNGPYGPYQTTKQAYYTYNSYSSIAVQAVTSMLPYLYRKGEQCTKALEEWKEYNDSKQQS